MKNQHPTALWVLCATETWERYGFYVIQSLIALYLLMHLHMADTNIYLLVGAFTALTYISPLIGGWIADRFLGQKQSVLFGALILLASYLGLAFSNALHGIIYALVSVAVGTGLLKPNISSLLGRQYAPLDPRRNSGFTIFYIGINFGILLGTTLPSQLQILWGWRVCFISAALGLFVAFLVFSIGIRVLQIPNYAILQAQQRRWSNYGWTVIILAAFFALSYWVLVSRTLSTIFFMLIVVLAIGYMIWAACHEKGEQRRKTLSFLLLCVISTFFWAFYFQIFLALTLFIARSVQPTLMGFLFPPPYYIAVQSIGILLFGVILQKFWAKRPIKNIAYNTSVKFSIAILLMCVAYGLIVLAIGNPHSAQLVSPWLVIVAYLVISLAELMLSPIGLAAVTCLIRPQIISTMMGIFFVTLGLGGYLAGKLANISSIKQVTHSIELIKINYSFTFLKLTAMLAGIFILSVLITVIIKMLFRERC